MKRRIWELDVLRGIFVMIMIVGHLTFDLVDLYGIWHLKNPGLYHFARDWAGLFFFVISGICATFSRRTVKRGVQVFLCGMLCSAVTAGIYFLGMSGRSIIIWFGALHGLGLCMILWPAFRKLPVWALGLLGVGIIAGGLYILEHVRVQVTFLFPLGLTYPGFSSSDYFPLLPNFGYFLLGAVIGRLCYKEKKSLLPNVRTDFFVIRFLSFCGRNSLVIYLVHQPVLAAVTGVIAMALR